MKMMNGCWRIKFEYEGLTNHYRVGVEVEQYCVEVEQCCPLQPAGRELGLESELLLRMKQRADLR
jgi:hypothetical protein